ncbi:hypothetical protein WMY93_033739 [Mugilogobius chulae]|uniref:Uncharacterized protein n=1 Tax=Mugilogobius chulae TaxID=88201 RepID=A0AAW0MG86_9GOBI
MLRGATTICIGAPPCVRAMHGGMASWAGRRRVPPVRPRPSRIWPATAPVQVSATVIQRCFRRHLVRRQVQTGVVPLPSDGHAPLGAGGGRSSGLFDGQDAPEREGLIAHMMRENYAAGLFGFERCNDELSAGAVSSAGVISSPPSYDSVTRAAAEEEGGVTGATANHSVTREAADESDGQIYDGVNGANGGIQSANLLSVPGSSLLSVPAPYDRPGAKEPAAAPVFAPASTPASTPASARAADQTDVCVSVSKDKLPPLDPASSSSSKDTPLLAQPANQLSPRAPGPAHRATPPRSPVAAETQQKPRHKADSSSTNQENGP